MKIFTTGMTIACVALQGQRLQEKTMDVASSGRIHLPSPRLDSRMSVEQALHQRRSIQEYKQNEPLTLEEVSQLLWAAQGVTTADGLRTAPSAGALFPLEVYVVAGNVRTLQPGFYHYQPRGHAIVRVTEADKRRELRGAALDQDQLRDAPVIIVSQLSMSGR